MPGRCVGYVFTGEDKLAFRRVINPADQVEYGGFTGTVRADDREDLALFDVETDRVDGADTAKVNRYVFGGEQQSSQALRSGVRFLPPTTGLAHERIGFKPQFDLQP